MSGSGVVSDDFTVGTASTTSNAYNDFPFSTYWHDARSEFLYRVIDLSNAGLNTAANITKIAFNVYSANGYEMQNFSVGMKLTTDSDLLTYSFGSGYTTVYSGSQTISGTGWHVITLDTPFAWDGTSNLAIQICFNNTGYSSDSEVYYWNAGGVLQRKIQHIL